MLTVQISGLTPHNDTTPITGLLEALVSELRVLRRLSDGDKRPLVLQRANDYGHIKCTIADPEEMVGSLDGVTHQNGGQDWMVGYYVPTSEFLKMQEHTAVMDAQTQGLVATCGPSGDPASMRDACLFAVSPKLYALCQQVLALTLTGQTAKSLIPELQAVLEQVPQGTVSSPAANQKGIHSVFE
ncbi:MAG: hypothetical protein IT327_02700 [Anaerolineae bacterium]|nr:hypothetical protein [Anaerolineae bacterium]